jgi:hypothetical protein
VKFVQIPKSQPVPPEAIERLQRKFTEAKEDEERKKFWAMVQRTKQPIDYERGLPIG